MTLPSSHSKFYSVLEGGIGSAGQGFNQHRPREFAFIVNSVSAFKTLSKSRQRSLSSNAWSFADWIDSIEDAAHRQMRHVLLYLLYPDTFERISVSSHKRQISETFGGLCTGITFPDSDGELLKLDRQLHKIRKELQSKKRTQKFDFYQRDIEPLWHTDSSHSRKKKSFRLPDEIQRGRGFYEGVSKSVMVNVYERNPKARRECIAHYGARCFICGFNFEDVYGARGKDYIHVHHLIPLSKIKKHYKIKPIQDMRPVCPNCHAMIHVGRLISPEDLQLLIRRNTSK